jgi:hypothetical protein
MNFEIRDGKEHLPDEEDIYGVNDIEERERFDSLFGGNTQEDRVRRRKVIIQVISLLVLLSFALAFGVPGIRHIFGW